MLKPYEPTEEAQAVLAELRRSDIYYGEALLLTSEGIYPVEGLLYLLNRPEQYIAIPVHKDHLPKHLYGDVVYLRPFSDTAETIRAPFGGDTVYQIKPRLPRPRTGAYKLPAPKNR
jgi:hypothetical protein